MAITSTERSILSQARAIILREACDQQAERDQMEQARSWAANVAITSADFFEAQSASTAASQLAHAIAILENQTRHSQDAIDHIEAMIGYRD